MSTAVIGTGKIGSAVARLLAEGGEEPRTTLFYATDDDQAGDRAEQLIEAAGFSPYRVGGVDQSLRIEVLGDLHPFGGLDGTNPTEKTAASLVWVALAAPGGAQVESRSSR